MDKDNPHHVSLHPLPATFLQALACIPVGILFVVKFLDESMV